MTTKHIRLELFTIILIAHLDKFVLLTQLTNQTEHDYIGRRKWRIVGVILLVVLCLTMLRRRMPLTVVKNNLLGDIDRSSHNQLIEPLRDVAGYKWSEIPAEYKFDCIRIPRFSQHLANNVLIIFLGKSEVDA